MKKLNFLLFMIALAILSGMIVSVVSVYAEDQPAMMADKDKSQKYDPCEDPNCANMSAIKPQGDMAMKMGGDMPDQMCPMMQKMGKGMGKGMMQCKMMDMGQQGMGKCPMCQMMKDNKPMPGDPMYILANADKLKLTDQQKMTIETTHLALRKDMIRKQADLEIANIELEALMKSDKPDLDAVKTQINKIADMEAEMKFAHVKFGVDVKSALTKEQLDTLKMIKEHEAHKAKMDDSADKPEAKPMPKQEMKMEHHNK